METENPKRRILRLPQVEEKSGLKRDSIYRLAKLGRFPAPIKLSARASGWIESEIEAYLDRRIAERTASAPGAA